MSPPDSVVPHQPTWHEDCGQICGPLRPCLPRVPHHIERVGSTSVPGLDAKPVIDLDVVVPAANHVAPAIAALADAGCVHEGNLGIAGREAFEMLPGCRCTTSTLSCTIRSLTANIWTFATFCAPIPPKPNGMRPSNRSCPRPWTRTASHT